MFTKVIEYKDYDGNTRKEEFQFNFSKAEIFDLNLRTPGGLHAFYSKMIETLNGQELADQFKFLIQRSYGVKSLDGRRFIKNDEVLKNFTETEAYSQLYIELATNSQSAAAFINGIMPADLVEQAIKEGEAKGVDTKVLQMPNIEAPVPAAPVDPVMPRDVSAEIPTQQVSPVYSPDVPPVAPVNPQA